MPTYPYRITESTRRKVEEQLGIQFYEDPPGSGKWSFPGMPIKVEIWPDSMALATEDGEEVAQMGGLQKLSSDAVEYDCDGGCGTKIWISEPIRGARKICPSCAVEAMTEDEDDDKFLLP